jgi:hypothetical protein
MVSELASEAARRKTLDLASDQHGRAFEGGDPGRRSGMEPRA